MTATRPSVAVEQQSLSHSIALHLVPGILTTVAYLLLAPVMMAAGYPALFGLLLATLLVLVPAELGYLLYQSKRTTGTFSLQGVVVYREPIPARQYVGWTLGFIAWGFLSSAVFSPVDRLAGQYLFSWLPSWFFVSSIAQFAVYSRAVLWATFGIGVVAHVAGPIVEELYFRGYLLPRLARFGSRAPILNAAVFSLYHLWTPWQNVSRFLFIAPVVYVVWKKQNIYLAMWVHVILNLIVWCLTFAPILGAHR